MRIAPLILLAGCAAAASPPRRAPTSTEWRASREALERLRQAMPARAYALDASVTMREPRSGRVFDARGAVAVLPGRAMRMILVGPGGATALDAWVTRDRWRLAVPALEMVKRGAETVAGMPVGFFRWWFLAPLEGTLLDASGDRWFLLRSGAAIVEIERGPGVRASRREHGTTERIEATSLSPRAGDHARYVEESTGLEVDVTIEGVRTEGIEPEAFIDPGGT